jgi:hypothetical protein
VYWYTKVINGIALIALLGCCILGLQAWWVLVTPIALAVTWHAWMYALVTTSASVFVVLAKLYILGVELLQGTRHG